MTATTTEKKSHRRESLDDIVKKEEQVVASTGCGCMGRYPLMTVIAAATLGLAVGIGLSFWDDDEGDAKEKTIKWIGLVGVLFIRALKCVILPLVFINVSVKFKRYPTSINFPSRLTDLVPSSYSRWPLLLST